MTSSPSSSANSARSLREEWSHWLDLERRFNAARSSEELRQVAAEIPLEIAAPELHSLQCSLLLRAWTSLPKPQLPAWWKAPMPASSRLTWARLALLVEPTACVEVLDKSIPWAPVLSGLDLLGAPEPLAVLEALLSAEDQVPRSRALAALCDVVVQGYSSVGDIHQLLLRLLSSPDRGLRLGALRVLALPWACMLQVPGEILERHLASSDEEEALAAIEVAGVRGDAVAMQGLSSEKLALRQAAIRWTGHLGNQESLALLLEAAHSRPEWLGELALAALVELHHRGFFLKGDQALAVLELLELGVPLATDALAGLLFVARREILEVISGLDVDDPDWLHLAPLLAAWLRAPRPPAGLFEALLWVGAGTQRPAVVTLVLGLLKALALDLPDAPRAAIEELALARLGEHPQGCMDVLDVVGQEATYLRLRGEKKILPGHVFSLLWWLTPVEERGALMAQAKPSWITGRVRASLEPVVARETLDWLWLQGGTEEIESSLIALTEVATPDDLETLQQGLRRALEKAVAQPWERSTGVVTGRATGEDPWLGGEERWQLPERCVRAFEAMEERWRRRYRRPACLMAPGRRLLPELLLEMLPTASAAALRAGILRSLTALEHPLIPAKGAEALLSKDPDTVKLGARLLAREGAPWLGLELRRGIDQQDERILRACMEALSEAVPSVARPAALQCLAHRNMNLKKIGAEALRKVGSSREVGVLLRWLGQHDNPGFRASLKGALATSLKEGARAGVLSALHSANGEERRCRLLIDCLGTVSVGLVRRLARQRPAWLRWLLEAIVRKEVSLLGGNLRDIEPELRAAAVPFPAAPAPPVFPEHPSKEDPFREAVDNLFFEGWSPERAQAVLARWPDVLDADRVEKLRIFLGPWLDWILVRKDTRPVLLVRAVLRQPRATETELIARAQAGLLAAFEESPRGRRAELVPMLEALLPRMDPLERLDLGELVRHHLDGIPGLDRSPLGLLRSCGLVITRADLERSLDGVGSVKNPAEVRRTILADAFGTTGTPPRKLKSVLPSSGALDAVQEERLSEALRAHGATSLEALRSSWPPGAEEATLRLLVYELPTAWPTATVRAAALDWMETLHPIGVSGWLVAPRVSQKRQSTPPDPLKTHRVKLVRLATWLRGEIGAESAGIGAVYSGFSGLLDSLTPDELQTALEQGETKRLFELLWYLTGQEGLAARVTAELLARWETLSEHQRLELGRQMSKKKALPEWQEPSSNEAKRAARARLWSTEIVAPVRSLREASADDRTTWYDAAKGEDEEAARVALSRLSEQPDARWRELVMERAEHGSARVRHHALRLIRKTLPREDTLRAARWFLEDDDPSARRMAIRIVCHGKDEEALPQVVACLLDPVAWVRKEAASGLLLMREEALPWVERACARLRPDEARRLRTTLDKLREGGR